MRNSDILSDFSHGLFIVDGARAKTQARKVELPIVL